jgi:hypothetical protein
MKFPLLALGIALLAISFALAIGIAATRAALRRRRLPDGPAPVLIGPHNFLEEFQFASYETSAAPLVRRLRIQFGCMMVCGPIGAMLFFSNWW